MTELDEEDIERICESLQNADLSLISANSYEGKELWNPDNIESISYRLKEDINVDLKR